MQFLHHLIVFVYFIDSQAYGLAWYGQGSGTVGYQNFNCSGSELNVTQCTYTTPSTCSHAMDAAVSCIYDTPCSARGSGCCTSGCYISSMACWCDVTCHIFNDCCTGIEYTCPGNTSTSTSWIHVLYATTTYEPRVDKTRHIFLYHN